MNKNPRNSRRLAQVLMAMALMMWMPKVAAQTFEYPEHDDDEKIAVSFQGSRPTISDFVTAILSQSSDRVFCERAYGDWKRYQQKRPLSRNSSISVDTRNGYMQYQYVGEEENDTTVMEMCFWNCADGKRKLVCANANCRMNGEYGRYDHTGTYFYVYDNKTRIMRTVWPEDIGALYEGDGINVFFLPRRGKDIRVQASGCGDQWNEVLEWDGYKFTSRILP